MLRDTIKVQVKEGEEVVIRLRSPFRRIIGDETRRHAYQAGRETLLAVRGVLDDIIQRVGGPEERPPGREEIKVE